VPNVSSAPLVSIITPVFNRAWSIEDCLRSVDEQSYRHIEHIVVDGGSTDGTVDVISNFAATTNIKWISEPDSGMYDAVNKGLRMASGSVLAYLNSDDLYLPWSVEVAVAGLHSSGAELVYGDLGVLTIGEPTSFYPQFYRSFDMNYFTHFATLAQPTLFWRRDVTERIGFFDESYSLIADCEYWLRARTRGFSLHHVDEVLAVQIEHAGTLRETQPQQLEAEFRRLRTHYTPAAGPPRHRRLQGLRRRFAWRWHQLSFVTGGRLGIHRRWPRFMTWLKDSGIRIRKSAFLWFLLPQPLRPSSASLLDATALADSLRGRG
jgi:glycosyltransferase involved in cell wall biosynthesis